MFSLVVLLGIMLWYTRKWIYLASKSFNLKNNGFLYQRKLYTPIYIYVYIFVSTKIDRTACKGLFRGAFICFDITLAYYESILLRYFLNCSGESFFNIQSEILFLYDISTYLHIILQFSGIFIIINIDIIKLKELVFSLKCTS